MKKQIKILLLYGLLLLLFPFSVFALTGSIDELQRLFGGEHTLGATVLFPGGGGTGTSTAPTAGQLLRGKSTGVYELLATSTDGSVLWLDTNGYPAWAATSSLGVVGIVSTSTVPTISQLAYWTSAGTPSTLGTVATTSLTATSPLSLSQPISVIGGSASALSLSTAGDWTGTFDSQEGSYYLNANNLTNFGTPFWTFFNATTTTALAEGNNLYWTNNRFDTRLAATTTLPQLTTLSNLTTVGALTSGSLGAGFTDVPVLQGGTGLSSFTASSLLYSNSDGTALAFAATSTLNIGGNAGTATALASNPADCGANTWATTIAANGDLTCSAITYAGITAMTSANFAGLISDETGTAGKVVFDTSPTLITPILGYASSTQLTTTNSTYLATEGGNVGIGTTTPNSLLSLYQASADTALTFGNSNATMWTMGTDISDGSKFKIASSSALGTNDRLTIDTNGNVGIGTTGPIYNLDVSENSALASIYTDFPVVRVINPSAATHSFSAMEVSANNTTVIGDLLVDGLGTGSAILGSDAGVILMSRSNHILALGVNDTEKMRIDTTGNVGIGTTSPTTLIQAGSTATTTISALSSSGDKGGRLILMDTNGSTCTEITTNAGVITGKAVTCP